MDIYSGYVFMAVVMLALALIIPAVLLISLFALMNWCVKRRDAGHETRL